jgi:transglutaminase-like putative cysteine protease
VQLKERARRGRRSRRLSASSLFRRLCNHSTAAYRSMRAPRGVRVHKEYVVYGRHAKQAVTAIANRIHFVLCSSNHISRASASVAVSDGFPPSPPSIKRSDPSVKVTSTVFSHARPRLAPPPRELRIEGYTESSCSTISKHLRNISQPLPPLTPQPIPPTSTSSPRNTSSLSTTPHTHRQQHG